MTKQAKDKCLDILAKMKVSGEITADQYDKACNDVLSTKYRIQNKNGTILNAGTDERSWFSLEAARKIVNYSQGQRIVEHDGVNVLWETL